MYLGICESVFVHKQRELKWVRSGWGREKEGERGSG